MFPVCAGGASLLTDVGNSSFQTEAALKSSPKRARPFASFDSKECWLRRSFGDQPVWRLKKMDLSGNALSDEAGRGSARSAG